MALQVRPARLDDPDDAAAVVALTDGYAQDPMGGGRPLSGPARARLVPALREHPAVGVLLCLDGKRRVAQGATPAEARAAGRPIGILIWVLSFSSFTAAPVLNVHDIAVVPKWRGRGVGRRLLEAAETEARARGCSKMSLEVLPENPAKRLYERMGFAFRSEFWRKDL